MHVVSTAGHVDHGKSTLIQALTGRDPDRLAEEKRRGLTIDLGFAWATLPSGREVGFVDVPGHRRFIRNMLAGVGSVDTTLFVVAANEGWMPQSEEHHQILRLLGVHRGIVALTKVDLVDADLLELAREEVAERLGDAWRIVEVAAPSGRGIDELRAALDELLGEVPVSHDLGRPRLWIDRSFTMRGAGTVVTGTLTGGSLRVDEQVVLLPSGERARVRSIHTHEVEREVGLPGSRVALNLAGLERSEARRGNAVVRPGQWRLSDRVDVRLAPDTRLRPKGAYTIHLGTADLAVRVQPTRDGEFARVVLSSPLPIAPGDRFILRDTGTHTTAGGGTVLDVAPLGRLDAPRLARRAEVGPGAPMLEALLEERGHVALVDVGALIGAHAQPALTLGGHAVSEAWADDVVEQVRTAVRRYHEEQPAEPGMTREELQRAVGIPAPLLAALLPRTGLGVEAEIVHDPGHRVDVDALLHLLADAGLSPPTIAELHLSQRLVAMLVRDDAVVVAGPYAFRRNDFDRACAIVRALIEDGGPQTAGALRDALHVTRKHAIPLLEAMDAAGVTRRSGDLRS